jgi:hypothetical protein
MPEKRLVVGKRIPEKGLLKTNNRPFRRLAEKRCRSQKCWKSMETCWKQPPATDSGNLPLTATG